MFGRDRLCFGAECRFPVLKIHVFCAQQVDVSKNKVSSTTAPRIRIARGVVSSSACAEKAAHHMLKHALDYLTSKGIQCKKEEDPETDYKLSCFARGSGRMDIKFEAEITAVQDLRNMHALQLRRLQGNAWEWKALVDNLLRGFSIS